MSILSPFFRVTIAFLMSASFVLYSIRLRPSRPFADGGADVDDADLEQLFDRVADLDLVRLQRDLEGDEICAASRRGPCSSR